MKYLTFVRLSESFRNSPPPAALDEAMGKFMDKCLKEGTLVDTGGLAPSQLGSRIRVKNGEMKVTDGPFTEAKEVIGGWAILNAETRDEAMRVAKEFMKLHLDHWPEFEGECEVRPIEFKLIP